MITHYCYVVSCLLSIFLFLAVRRKSTRIFQLFGSFVILLIPFVMVYLFPFAAINATLMVCVLPIVLSIFLLLLTRVKRTSDLVALPMTTRTFVLGLAIFLLLLAVQMLSLTIVYGFPWVKATFTIDDVDAVLFTLQTSKQGAEMVVLRSFYENVFISMMKFLLVSWGCFFAVMGFICLRNDNYELKFLGCRLFFNKNNKGRDVLIGCCVITVFSVLFALMSLPVLGKSALDIYKAYTRERVFVESDLYKQYYVSPDTLSIEFSQKKNLIFIMLESMGTNYISELPELKKMQEDFLSFYPGGESVATQRWTIGSQISKYCGIPLKFPSYEGIEQFLPNAKCMQDILDEAGYRQLFVQGTDKMFASLDHFLETHANVEMHDFTYYRDRDNIKKLISLWGIDG